MSVISTINSGDSISSSRTVINQNFTNLNSDKVETSAIDTDTTLAANSDAKIPTQKAVKAYVDAGGNVNASTTNKGIVEIASATEAANGTDVGGSGAPLVVQPSQLVALKTQQITYNLSGSPHTWTKDTGLVRIRVQAWGGGGSGGSTNSQNNTSGGGGGGYIDKWFEASELGATETVTIGAGGTGATNSNGNNGGNTTFGSLLTAYGGGGGLIGNISIAGGNGASSFSAAAGNVDAGAGVAGTAGGSGTNGGGAGGGSNSGGSSAGNGGGSIFGGAGGGGGYVGNFAGGGTSLFGGNGSAASSSTTSAGSTPGGGSGGSRGGSSGAGGNGRCIVTEYYV